MGSLIIITAVFLVQLFWKKRSKFHGYLEIVVPLYFVMFYSVLLCLDKRNIPLSHRFQINWVIPCVLLIGLTVSEIRRQKLKLIFQSIILFTLLLGPILGGKRWQNFTGGVIPGYSKLMYNFVSMLSTESGNCFTQSVNEKSYKMNER